MSDEQPDSRSGAAQYCNVCNGYVPTFIAPKPAVVSKWCECEYMAPAGTHPAQPQQPDTGADALVKHMVERFLSWRLPETFNPDNGVRFEAPEEGVNRLAHWPSGTNILNYDEASAMVRHMLIGAPR